MCVGLSGLIGYGSGCTVFVLLLDFLFIFYFVQCLFMFLKSKCTTGLRSVECEGHNV